MAANSGANIFTSQSAAIDQGQSKNDDNVSKMNGDGVTPIGSLYSWTQTEEEV